MTPEDNPHSVRYLRDLAGEQPLPVGTKVIVQENAWIFSSVGNTRPEIAAQLGWEQSNVWMPEPRFQYQIVRHPEISLPIEAMAYVLTHPSCVNEVPNKPEVRFLIEANDMRSAEFLLSRSVRLVDLIVKLWIVDDNIMLRAFHLAPTRRGPEGRQRWP